MSQAVFYRYENVPEQSPVCMPKNMLDVSVSNLLVGELLGRLERFSDGTEGPAMYPWASRFAMGFPLPDWQRPAVWTIDQQVRFIRSLWMGVDVGTYMVNRLVEFTSEGTYSKFSDALIDGQQRLTALEHYVYNAFPVPDAAGTPRFWRELGRVERRRFSGLSFACASIKSDNEQMLRIAYDLRNFSGTAHTEDQRAVPQ